MTMIIIPRQNSSDTLMAVPRSQYMEFLAWQKKVKAVKTFNPTATQKRTLKHARIVKEYEKKA